MDADFTEHQKFILTVSCVPGMGSVRLRSLLEVCHSLESFQEEFKYGRSLKISGIGTKLIETLREFLFNKSFINRVSEEVKKQEEYLHRYNATFLSIWDKEYPSCLKQISDAPVFFFVRGNVSILSNPCIAIVGTRVPTNYGRKVAKDVARISAEHGICIVSGLAYGIDSIAHSEACKANGATVAVLGSGADRIYTDTKGTLTSSILEKGAIVSEFFFNTEPLPENFPRRNRIISGLSRVVLVIESNIDGGALITAKYAREQSREVLAIPGHIYSEKSKGTNKLIQDGAKLIAKSHDVLKEFDLPKSHQKEIGETASLEDLSDIQKKIVLALKPDETKHIDSLSYDTEMDISVVQLALFELELKDIVEQQIGKQYSLRKSIK